MWPPTKSRWFDLDAKYIITTLIAVCALGLGVVNTYIASFRQVDEMRVIVDSMPGLSPHRKGLQLIGPIALSFSNSGTRTVAITDMYLVVVQPPKKANDVEACGEGLGSLAHEPGADVGDWYYPIDHTAIVTDKESAAEFDRQLTWYELGVEPFIVEAHQIAFKKLPVHREQFIEFTSQNRQAKGKADLCLELDLIYANKKLRAGLALTGNEWEFVGDEKSDEAEGFASYYSGTGPFVILDNR
jgi:hypothetical protein